MALARTADTPGLGGTAHVNDVRFWNDRSNQDGEAITALIVHRRAQTREFRIRHSRLQITGMCIVRDRDTRLIASRGRMLAMHKATRH